MFHMLLPIGCLRLILLPWLARKSGSGWLTPTLPNDDIAINKHIMLLLLLYPCSDQVAPGKGRVTKLSTPPPRPPPPRPPPPPVIDDSSLDVTTSEKSVSGGAGAGARELAGHGRGDTAELSRRELAQQRRSLLMKLFADTGTAKIPAVLR